LIKSSSDARYVYSVESEKATLKATKEQFSVELSDLQVQAAAYLEIPS
jgi:hypothetical protein